MRISFAAVINPILIMGLGAYSVGEGAGTMEGIGGSAALGGGTLSGTGGDGILGIGCFGGAVFFAGDVETVRGSGAFARALCFPQATKNILRRMAKKKIASVFEP
jgi:hypothetical protein